MIITFSVDPNKHNIIYEGIEKAKENGNLSRYIRECILKFESKKIKEDQFYLILEKLEKLEKILSCGISINNEESKDEIADQGVIDDILGQF